MCKRQKERQKKEDGMFAVERACVLLFKSRPACNNSTDLMLESAVAKWSGSTHCLAPIDNQGVSSQWMSQYQIQDRAYAHPVVAARTQ